jgi:hypothetical protein
MYSEGVKVLLFLLKNGKRSIDINIKRLVAECQGKQESVVELGAPLEREYIRSIALRPRSS